MTEDKLVRVIALRDAPGEGMAWDRARAVVYLWAIVELLFVTNPWQVSSRLRVAALKAFGARIGTGVIFRPRTRVKFPWKLTIGSDSWIGEGVWFHNQDHITVGSNVVISQETMLTTGSHAVRTNMALITRRIVIEDGAWLTSRCIVLGGAHIGTSAVIHPMTVVTGNVPAARMWSASGDQGPRFAPPSPTES